MKTAKISIDSIKDSDGWHELIHELKFDSFREANPDLSEDELHEKFYKEIVCKVFDCGEYADIEIEVNENLKIVGGSIFPFNS